MKSLNILIADDHLLIRTGLKKILRDEFMDAIIVEVSNGIELLAAVRQKKFDIVISDISMPQMTGLDALKQMRSEHINYPVLFLSIHPEDQYAIRSIKAGGSGYLTKDLASDELVMAVRQILNGRKYITFSVAERLALSLDNDEKLPHQQLSDREFSVLVLIASGKTVSEIAAELSLSVPTISTYRARILDKMKMKTNAELTHYAVKEGIA